LKDLRRREYKKRFPSDLMASARYPSNLISYSHCAPSGSLETARHSIGSMNAAERIGREFKFLFNKRFDKDIPIRNRNSNRGTTFVDASRAPELSIYDRAVMKTNNGACASTTLKRVASSSYFRQCSDFI